MALRIHKAIDKQNSFQKRSLALRIYDAIDATSVEKKLTDYFFIGFKMKIDERYKTQIYNVKINISTYFF